MGKEWWKRIVSFCVRFFKYFGFSEVRDFAGVVIGA